MAIAQAVKDFDDRLVLFGLANSELIRAGKQVGLETAQEAFADRTYQMMEHLHREVKRMLFYMIRTMSLNKHYVSQKMEK